jgi:4-hydroxyphenylpyruvate dioxygenase-like putative hemolysin
LGDINVIEFPDAFIFLSVQNPTGPTRGTAFDHIGFAVPNVPAMATKLAAAGYQETMGREPKPGEPPPAASGTSAVYGRFAYFLGPDGVKIELVTSDQKDAAPIVAHHIHFINKQYVEMQQWYMKAFDATLRPGQTDYFIGADLPGVGYMLNFFSWLPAQVLVGTKGRAIDHVGFEVKNLQEFTKGLATKGIKLTEPYRRAPELDNMGIAFMMDPWGTSIELTEGLRNLR